MASLYAWASVITPLFGMVMSMLSHRYAYMQMSSLLAIIFVIAALKLYKDDHKNHH